PFDHRFLAVEKDELQRILKLEVSRRACKFQKPSGARAAVACADKPDILKVFGVVMSGDGDHRGLRTPANCSDVDHMSKSERRPCIEFIKLRLEPGFLQFTDNVIPSLGQRLATRRPRSEPN